MSQKQNKNPSPLRVKFNQFAESADNFLFRAANTIKKSFNRASQWAPSVFDKASGHLALRTGMSQQTAKKALYWTTMLTSLTAIGIRAPSLYQNAKDPEVIDVRIWDVGSSSSSSRELDTDQGYLTMVKNQKGTADLEQNAVYMVKTHGASFRWGWPFYSRDVEKISKYKFVDIQFPKEIAEMYARDKAYLDAHPDGVEKTTRRNWTPKVLNPNDYSSNLKFYAAIISDAGAQNNVDTLYMMSQLIQESHGNTNALGPMTRYGRARGPWQFIDMTSKRFGIDPYNPIQSTYASAQYTRILLDMFDGDYRKACAAYNWGEGNLQKCINRHGDNWDKNLPAETDNYIREIFGRLGGNVPSDRKVPASNVRPNPALSMKM